MNQLLHMDFSGESMVFIHYVEMPMLPRKDEKTQF